MEGNWIVCGVRWRFKALGRISSVLTHRVLQKMCHQMQMQLCTGSCKIYGIKYCSWSTKLHSVTYQKIEIL